MLDKKIVDDVNEQANLVINQINEEIRQFKEEEMDYFKLTLSKEVEAYLHAELNELKLDTATLISQIQLKTKRDLLKVRQELAKDLFDEVNKRLSDFTKSDKYHDYLVNRIKKYSFDFNEGVFEVSKKDIELFKSILLELGFKSQIKESLISVGGFIYTNQKELLQVDETIDSMLLEQKDWFQNNSGFIL